VGIDQNIGESVQTHRQTTVET